MVTRKWVDQRLSEMLPALRDAGEGQHVEFMSEYPENGYELSKEIAAFASSNHGTILIGVSDYGELLGLPDLDSNATRDKLLRRIEGVCSGNIRPSITPIVKFAQENDVIVLAIKVPRGTQPVYYSKHTPYIRHLSSSRPAEPHEVIDRIAEYLAATPVEPAEDTLESNFLSSIAEVLVTTRMLADQVESRNINPWREYIFSEANYLATQFRESATEEIAIGMKLDNTLKNIADHLDKAASHIHTMGEDSWMTYIGHWVAARDHAREAMEKHVDPVPLSARSREQIRDIIHKAMRQLVDLDSRTEKMARDGRMEELQDDASRIGSLLLKLTYYRIDDISPSFALKLRPLANDLNLIETERIYLDGGKSVERILGKIDDLSKRIQLLVSEEGI
ncbi:MAG: ATP-binding protein [Candidatus Dadabacteria bacterium]|nr:ATP-binding protein [Candidatus Dadabacteria bacterium]